MSFLTVDLIFRNFRDDFTHSQPHGFVVTFKNFPLCGAFSVPSLCAMTGSTKRSAVFASSFPARYFERHGKYASHLRR